MESVFYRLGAKEGHEHGHRWGHVGQRGPGRAGSRLHSDTQSWVTFTREGLDRAALDPLETTAASGRAVGVALGGRAEFWVMWELGQFHRQEARNEVLGPARKGQGDVPEV